MAAEWCGMTFHALSPGSCKIGRPCCGRGCDVAADEEGVDAGGARGNDVDVDADGRDVGAVEEGIDGAMDVLAWPCSVVSSRGCCAPDEEDAGGGGTEWWLILFPCSKGSTPNEKGTNQ